MKQLKKDNFYYGFGGEHYIISQFFALQYEAAKMEVDFGYDILVTNQYRRSKQVDERVKTIAVQVKTRTVYNDNYVNYEIDGVGIASFARIDFYIKKDDYNLITKDENGFLVCVFVDGYSAQFEPLKTIWFSSSHLKEIQESGYLGNGELKGKGDTYFITIEVAIKHDVNHLANFCIEQLEETNNGEYFSYLKELILESDISSKNMFEEARLLKFDDNTRDYVERHHWDLKSPLTDLRKIMNEEKVSLNWTREEYENRERGPYSYIMEHLTYKKMLYDLKIISN